MRRSKVMCRTSGGGPQFRRALLTAVALMLAAPAGVAFAGSTASGGSGTNQRPQPSHAALQSPATLPPVPNVPAAYTDGRPAQELLSNAITLSSLGLDDSVLLSAVELTQAKLDADASVVRRARQEAAAAEAQAEAARRNASLAKSELADLAGAIRQAVIYLYTSGPGALQISPNAGIATIYARDYAESTIGPLGVLARSEALRSSTRDSLRAASVSAKAASSAAEKARKALADQQRQLTQLKEELSFASAATLSDVQTDHMTLAFEAGRNLVNASALEFTTKSPVPGLVSTTPVALTWAFAELGKEYVWGATGPSTFDCSGLTQFVWRAAGVAVPRVAADQDGWTIPVPLSQLLPGDLVFFGTTDIHHVGIYIGAGLMINAPHTGTVVQVSSIWWSDLAGFGRVHYPGTPVPPHNTPSPGQPAEAVVVSKVGPVPSQTKPPSGWKPGPGSSTPIRVGAPTAGSGPPGPSTSTTEPPTPTTAPSGNGLTQSSTTTTAPPSTTPPSTPASPSTAPPSSSTSTTATGG